MASAKTLKIRRIAMRLTQEEVAKKAKISQSLYSQIETGQKPTKAVQEALAVLHTMKPKNNRTAGGDAKVGRKKS